MGWIPNFHFFKLGSNGGGGPGIPDRCVHVAMERKFQLTSRLRKICDDTLAEKMHKGDEFGFKLNKFLSRNQHVENSGPGWTN
jgi:hypothetical protein